MNKKNKKRETGCPIAFALDVFGDHWSLIVIRDILIKGFTTYGRLLESDEKIATNILASRLKELEESGIISKQKNPENKRQNIYKITQKGIELTPILVDMMEWSAKYDSNTKVSDEMLRAIKTGKEKFINNIQQRALSRI